MFWRVAWSHLLVRNMRVNSSWAGVRVSPTLKSVEWTKTRSPLRMRK